MNFPPSVVDAAILLASAGASLVVSSTTTSISNANPTLITPGTTAFGIWGVLFGLQALLIIWPALFSCLGRDKYGKEVRGWSPSGPRRDLRWSLVFIGAWAYLFLLHEQLTTFLPSVLCLALALVFASKAKANGSFARSAGPLSLLISWLTAATVVNAAVWLKYDFGWADSTLAAGFVLALFPAVACLGSYYNSDWLLSLGLIWPLIWIYERTQAWAPLVHIFLVVLGTWAFWGRGKDMGLAVRKASEAELPGMV